MLSRSGSKEKPLMMTLASRTTLTVARPLAPSGSSPPVIEGSPLRAPVSQQTERHLSLTLALDLVELPLRHQAGDHGSALVLRRKGAVNASLPSTGTLKLARCHVCSPLVELFNNNSWAPRRPERQFGGRFPRTKVLASLQARTRAWSRCLEARPRDDCGGGCWLAKFLPRYLNSNS